MHQKELINTELHYIQDLDMINEVFRIPLQKEGVLNPAELATVFGNWDELILVAKSLARDFQKRPQNLGSVLLEKMTELNAFVRFCENQQDALHFLEQKEKISPRFRAVHGHCCQHPKARGLPLSYFLLLPMTRVTKYPLVIEQIIKYSTEEGDDTDKVGLENAHEALRKLCSDVNQVVTEAESLQMLHWAQNHIKCDSIRPKLVFQSQTNSLGPRKFVHGGILFKSRSNRLLVGLLFNDFLMLTTPEDPIEDPDSFRLARSSELSLCLYKTPVLLQWASLQIPAAFSGVKSEDEARLIAISNGDEGVITLKALDSSARMLWTKQLEKAIEACKATTSKTDGIWNPPSRGLGRLLIELVCVRQLSIPSDFGVSPAVFCKLSLGEQQQMKELDLTKKDSLFTTQFVIDNENGQFHLGLQVHRVFAPDVSAGHLELSIQELVQQGSGSHRGPILKQIRLSNSEIQTPEATERTCVIIKFVVQLFRE